MTPRSDIEAVCPTRIPRQQSIVDDLDTTNEQHHDQEESTDG